MNIFAFELKKRWRSTMIWSLSVGAFVLFYFSFFESFGDESMKALMDDFPEALLKAVGMNTDISTVLGFYGATAAFAILCGAIFAFGLGINAVSVEERDLTADFLIPKPVTRQKILTAKVLASLTHIVAFAVFVAAASVLAIEIFKGNQEYTLRAFLLIQLGFFLTELIFFAMGLLISVCLRRMDSPLPFSFGIPVGLFVVNSFETLLQDTILKFLIPFDYFNPAQIAEDSALKAYGIVATAGLVTACISLTFVLYRRRNIATAM